MTATATPARRSVVFAVVVALLLGSGITVLLHEIGHWVVGAALGYPTRLYASAAISEGQTPVDDAISLLAGPVWSLVIGLVMTCWLPLRRSGGLGHLLWVMVGFTSFQEGVAYLVITPFGVGDTAGAVDQLGGGVVAQLLLMAVGIGGMFLQAKRFAVHLRRWAGDDLGLARAHAFVPWLIAAGCATLVQLAMLPTLRVATPEESAVIVIAAVAMTVFAPMSFIFWGRTAQASPARTEAAEPLTLPTVPVPLLVGYGVLLALNVVLNLTGPQLG